MTDPAPTDAERALLADALRGPISLRYREVGRRRIYGYGLPRVEASDHAGAVVLALARRGWMQNSPDFNEFVLTPEGRAAATPSTNIKAEG